MPGSAGVDPLHRPLSKAIQIAKIDVPEAFTKILQEEDSIPPGSDLDVALGDPGFSHGHLPRGVPIIPATIISSARRSDAALNAPGQEDILYFVDRRRNGDGMRILLVRLGAVGDCVHVLPALAALRARLPRAHIAWLVEDKAASLIRGHPHLDEVIVLERRRWARDSRRPWSFPRTVLGVVSTARSLRKRRFDVALDFQGNCRSGLWALLSGARPRFGFAGPTQREANYLFMNRHIRPPANRTHKVEKNLSLIRAIGIAGGEAAPVLPPAEDEAETMGLWLRQHSPTHRRPVFAIHPGVSAFGFFKRWPSQAYARLVRRISEAGMEAILTWGPGERREVERIREAAGGRGIVGPETRSLLALVELLRRCDLFIGSDSGPLHLASAVGTPTVALFGPKDPSRYGPYGAPARVVRSGVDCSPCDRRSCKDPVCMTTLGPERVFQAALSLLNS